MGRFRGADIVVFAVNLSWLERLGLISAPEGTSLRAASLSLRGLLPWWLALLLLLVGAFGAIWFYWRETARFGAVRRGLLAGLRIALIALVLALLMRPVLLATFEGERPRGIVLLIDNSQSMTRVDRRTSARDRLRLAIASGLVAPSAKSLGELDQSKLPDASRLSILKSILGNDQIDLRGKLSKIGPLETFLFDDRLRTARQSAGVRASLTGDGGKTALADAIHEVLNRRGADQPAALFIVSDGHDNASLRTLEEAGKLCRDRQVPLHILGAGSSEAGLLQLKEVTLPRTVFIDEKETVKDDPVEVPVRFRCRGFKKGTIVITLKLGDQEVIRRIPVRDKDELKEVLRLVPKKGKEGPRTASVTIKLEGVADTTDEYRQVVQVKTSRVKVLFVENTPRRDYQFIYPVMLRDRRVLARFLLLEADSDLAETKSDAETGAMFLDKFPENFPNAAPNDPDKRAYNLLILGDVPFSRIGPKLAARIETWVAEGGGLIILAGRNHAPAEFVGTDLAKILPVEFKKEEFTLDRLEKATAFKPKLTYDGEQSGMLALADEQDESLKLWKEELWKNNAGFWWHYPVTDLKPGAVSLLVHPELKIGKKPDQKAMPLIASHYYGRGEVLFVGVDETWRWRDGTSDKLTARFWGQIIAALGLPNLLGNSRRMTLELERGGAILGRPSTLRARILDTDHKPVTRPSVNAVLIDLDAKDEAGRKRSILLRRQRGQKGEYRAVLPADTAGRFEVQVKEDGVIEGATLPYRVELPPRHELEPAGLNEEALRSLAGTSGGKFYREEDLDRLAESIEPQMAAFEQRQEILLWNPLTLVLFVLLITAEWVLRKFSNLS